MEGNPITEKSVRIGLELKRKETKKPDKRPAYSVGLAIPIFSKTDIFHKLSAGVLIPFKFARIERGHC